MVGLEFMMQAFLLCKFSQVSIVRFKACSIGLSIAFILTRQVILGIKLFVQVCCVKLGPAGYVRFKACAICISVV